MVASSLLAKVKRRLATVFVKSGYCSLRNNEVLASDILSVTILWLKCRSQELTNSVSKTPMVGVEDKSNRPRHSAEGKKET